MERFAFPSAGLPFIHCRPGRVLHGLLQMFLREPRMARRYLVQPDLIVPGGGAMMLGCIVEVFRGQMMLLRAFVLIHCSGDLPVTRRGANGGPSFLCQLGTSQP